MYGKIEIRTLAAAGWGTDQEFIAFMEKGVPWKPDIVVLAFCSLNDIANNLSAIRQPHDTPWRLEGGMVKPFFILKENNQLELFKISGLKVKTISKFQIYTLELLSYLIHTQVKNESVPVPDIGIQKWIKGLDKRYLQMRHFAHIPAFEIKHLFF